MNKQNPILVFTNTQILNYYNYNVICNYCFEEPEPVIQNTYTYEENGVYYCASATQKGVYWYVYARNCPLMYTDPDGEFIQYIIGAVVGFINGLSQGASIANTKGATGWEKFGIMMAGAHIGADIGAATAGIGTAISNSLTAVKVAGIAGGAITGSVTGLASGATTGLAMGALSGQKGVDSWNSTWKGGLIGMGTGAGMGALTGMLNAFSNDKNVWLGRDRAMGRSNWSFKNTDIKPNYNWRGNTHYGERSHGMAATRNLSPIDRYHKALANNKTGIISDIENWICASNGQGYPNKSTIFTGNMIGRGEGIYSGWIPEGHQLHINFDGQNVLTLFPGNYPNTIINIPSSTTIIDMFYTGSYPAYMQGTTEITEAPFKFLIYGVWR